MPSSLPPLACLYDSVACVRLLLEKGADAAQVNTQDGSTVLHDAAASGDAELVQLVLARCPGHINTADTDGDTPLHNAARGCHEEVCRLLLSRGASPTAVNESGLTPAQEAEEGPVMALLQESEAAAKSTV